MQTKVSQFSKEEALIHYQKSYDRGAEDLETLIKLGRLYKEANAHATALFYLSKAIKLDPNNASVHADIGALCFKLGMDKEAKYHFYQAFHLSPKQHEYLSSAIFLAYKDLNNGLEEIVANTKFYYQNFILKNQAPYNHFSKLNPHKTKFRLGFVSADFYRHPIAYFLIPLLENLSSNFESYLYYNDNKEDVYTNKLRETANKFINIKNLNDQELAEWILKDEIDVLIDLSGLTYGGRLGVFSLKPAPLQISHLGYFGTLAMPEIDYIIADHNVISADEEKIFIEKIYKMDGFYSHSQIPDIPEANLEAPHKRNGYITFGSLNTLHKINPELINSWSQILKAVPKSKLLLNCIDLFSTCSKEHIYKLFAQHNISRDRLILKADIEREVFLSSYNDIDIALDSFPYSGGTTTMESLLMNVPVLTLHGQRWASNFSYSKLKTLQHPELIANSVEDYINKTIALAANPQAIDNYRKTLKIEVNNSFNIKAYTEKFAQAIKEMWQAKCANPELEINQEALWYFRKKDFGKALELYLRSLEINEKQIEVYIKITEILYEDHQVLKAINFCMKGLKIEPENPKLNALMAMNCSKFLMHKHSLYYAEKACELDPKNKNCFSTYLFLKNKDPNASLEDLKKIAGQYHEKYLSHIKVPTSIWKINPHKTKLRLGFLSGDISAHPVGFWIHDILKEINREQFEIFLYHSRDLTDDLTQKMIEMNGNYKNVVKLEDSRIAELIKNDDIDVLFDLSGYTKGERLGVLKYKAAPVQVSHLGYFGTLGIPEVDFLLADENVIKAGEEKFYSEKIYRIPGSYVHASLDRVPMPSLDIPYKRNGYITFGSMNGFHKITDEILLAWAKILLAVPNSKLLIDCLIVNADCCNTYLCKFFANQGIDRDRLIFKASRERIEFLNNYNNIDIALDAFPYNGGTTSIESLSMGVPVISIEGNKWASRFAASSLKAIGHPELIANDFDSYIKLAVELAAKPERIQNYKTQLRQDISNSKMALDKYIKNFEHAIWDIWKTKFNSKS